MVNNKVSFIWYWNLKEKKVISHKLEILLNGTVIDLESYYEQVSLINPFFLKDSYEQELEEIVSFLHSFLQDKVNGDSFTKEVFPSFFLDQLLKFPLQICFNGKTYEGDLVKQFVNPDIFIFPQEKQIQIDEKTSGILLPVFGKLYVFLNGAIHPLECGLRSDLIFKLYEKENLELATIDFFALIEEHGLDLLNKIFILPDIVSLEDDVEIISYFKAVDPKYFFSFFLRYKDQKISPNLEKLYKKFEDGQILFFIDNGILYYVPLNSPFYEKLSSFLRLLRKNFFSLLHEVQENHIQTEDFENVENVLLPWIKENAKLEDDKGETLDLKKVTFDQASLEIKATDNLMQNLGQAIDWFSINFNFIQDGQKLELKDLEQISSLGYLVQDQNLLLFSEKDKKLLDKVLSKVEIKDDQMFIRPFQLPHLFLENLDIKIPKSYEWLRSSKNFDPTMFDIDQKLPSLLRDYQEVGVMWMLFLYKLGLHGILADEMGLGKTLQVLSFFSILPHGIHLVICPRSLLYNWLAEIEKFFPNRWKVLILEGTPSEREKLFKNIDEYDLVITSYYLLHQDIDKYDKINFQTVVLDEAQHIKNREAKRTFSVKKLHARFRLALSGTPLENSVLELWSIFDFLLPGFLSTHQSFKKEYEQWIVSENEEKKREYLDKLKTLVMPFILRRTKKNVSKELPDKIEQYTLLDLTDKQKMIYMDILAKSKQRILELEKQSENNSRKYIEFLTILTRLRQVCLHPSLVLSREERAEQKVDYSESIKLVALRELLLQCLDSGQRVLIFSQFVSMLKIISDMLNEMQIDFHYIDGKVKDRLSLVNSFNEGEVPVFLISLRAGGTGLNLVGADTVIIFDPWWNPLVEDQAIDRAHRIGQKKVVHVYRMITKGTIEEKIYNLHAKKQFVFNQILEENENFIKNLSAKDLLTLLDN